MNFSENHLKAFAALSHDRNPLHLDPEYCRKTLFGKVVVYGVCSLLRGLGVWAEGRRFRLKSIRAEFRKPIFTDEEYQIEITESGEEVQIQYFKGTSPQASVAFVPESPLPEKEPAARAQGGDFVPLETPRDLDWGRTSDVVLCEDEYQYGMNLDELGGLQKYFGLAPGQMPGDQLNALLWASYYIGMECPGRQGILSRFELAFMPPSGADRGFYLTDLKLNYDPEFHRALITGRGKGISFLKLTAFRRPKPVGYPLHLIAAELGKSRAFEGKVVLVTGSSRGFGSVLAKAFALHGATPILNYHASERDARTALEEFRHLAPKAEALQGDVGDPADCARMAGEIREKFGGLDILVNNAVPHIYNRYYLEQPPDQFQEFVERSIRMVNLPCYHLLPILRDGLVVNISSGAARVPEKQLAHYVCSKFALEGLTRALAQEFRRHRFVVVRPPRMLTDQTNTNYVMKPLASPARVAAELITRLGGLEGLSGNFHEMDLEPEFGWVR